MLDNAHSLLRAVLTATGACLFQVQKALTSGSLTPPFVQAGLQEASKAIFKTPTMHSAGKDRRPAHLSKEVDADEGWLTLQRR